jgi:DNA-binding transcriptional regulator YhcF (GntR family)
MRHRGKRSLTKKLPKLSSLRLPHHTSGSHARLVLKLLRQTAQRNRQSTAVRFYSIRAVATRFHISPTIVARQYNTLQSEGLLATIWGSKTLIPARNEQVKMKALVVPVSVAELAQSESYRKYILNLHRRCRSLGFREHLIFFEASDQKGPKYLRRRSPPLSESIPTRCANAPLW